MKRKSLVRIHLIAAVVATLTIISFFTSSVAVELMGNEGMIKTVKTVIFYSLPLMIISMPAIYFTGNRLAGHSNHPDIMSKKKRMRWIAVNGITLTALASFLYYYSNYRSIDQTFLYVQLTEFAIGLTNLVLIALNIKTGLKLSGRLKE